MEQYGRAMGADVVAFEPGLDARQLLSSEQLSTALSRKPRLVAIRYDSVREEAGLTAYVDLILHTVSDDKLFVVLGLPLRGGSIVWPQSYAAWSLSVLDRISSQVLDELARRKPEPGQLVELGGFGEALHFDPQFAADAARKDRSCPGFENYWTTTQLLNRYGFASAQVQRGRVLEVACGPGYGSGLLLKGSNEIESYLGLDMDHEAIELAKRINVDPRATFQLTDLEVLVAEPFDWILSLETIEHTADPELFLLGLKRHLKPGGRMLVSLPCERWHGFHLNRSHWSSWNLQRIRHLVEPHFGRVDYFVYDRPSFEECAFDIARIRPLDASEDVSRHEDYLLLLSEPREVKLRRRLVVQRRYARGDALQATPIVRALKRKYPEYTLVVSTDVNEIFANNPDVDLLMATSSGFRPRADDMVVNLDEAYERRPQRHILDAYVEAAGVSLDDAHLRLYPDRWDYATVRILLERKLRSWTDRGVRHVISVHLGTTPDRSWPAEHWVGFLEIIRQRPELGVIVVGAGSDLTVDEHERLLSLVNRCDMLTTAACISLTDVLIGPDSSLLHVAAAVGTPAIGLYGMASPDRRIPYAAMQAAVIAPVDCAGCLHELPPPVTDPRCKFGQSFCMQAIVPETVLKRLEGLLDMLAPDAWQRRFALHTADGRSRDAGNGAVERSPQLGAVAPVAASAESVSPPALLVGTERAWLTHAHEETARTFTVLVRTGTTSGVPQETRASLSAQWAPPGGIVEVTGGGVGPLNAAIAGCTTEWVLVLRVGDVCEPSLLATLARCVEQHPQWGVVYLDEAQIGDGDEPVNAHFKPDFNLDYLRSLPYTGNAVAVRRELFDALGGFDVRYDGIEEQDFLLRTYEQRGAEAIGHIPGVMLRRAPGVTLSERPLAEVLEAGRESIAAHLARLGIGAQVEYGTLPATFRIRYLHEARPLVSIIIPTRNQRPMLERCLESLLAHTAWPNYEILIVDNGSDEPDALQYLEGLKTLGADLAGQIRVLDYPHAFNYSAMNNLAAAEARGEYLLLLNNDTAALHDEWLDAMMAHAQRPEVGIVGAKLLYPDGKVQHAGVVLGIKGPAEHPFIGHDAKAPGYYGRLQVDQDYSAVTGACLLVRKTLFDQVGGLDADQLSVSYSDIDLCLKIGKLDKLVVWTPHALLLHEGSKSQTAGVEAAADQAKQERFAREQAAMFDRWMPQIANDPAYNRCLSLGSTDFVPDPDPALCWDPGWRPVPRIITQSGDRMGCGEYRIIAPTRALANAGRIQGQETQRIYTPPELSRLNPDALVLQRQIETHQIAAIERHKRFNDVFCVFEIDDLITNLPVKSAHRKHMPKDMFKRLRRSVALCDRLVVATDTLADAYSGLASDVRVAPNYLEEARWGHFAPQRLVSRKPRVGWAGGVSHTGDLELIGGVIEELRNDVEWVFFGMCPERLRPFVHEFHAPVPLDQYAQTLAGLNLDLALAPLEDVPFNHAKSHLRLLEYGILGYPVVCSDLTPYRGDFPVTRVRNRHRDWVDAIRAHLADLAATQAQGDRLRGHVRRHWLLENNLDVWMKAWLPD